MGGGKSPMGKGGGKSKIGGGASVKFTQADKVDAAEHYMAPEGFEMNNLLRGLSVDESYGTIAELRAWSDALTELLDEQSLPSAKTVFRGASFDTLTDYRKRFYVDR